MIYTDILNDLARFITEVNNVNIVQMCGLTIGNTATKLRTTQRIVFSIFNKQSILEPADNIVITPCSVQAVSTFCYYLVSVNQDYTPVVTVTKGTDNLYNLPDTPWGQVAIAVFKVTTDSVTTFTAGTTALSASGISSVYYDLDVGIATKLINQALRGIERKSNFSGMSVRYTYSLAAGTTASFDNPIPLYKQFMEEGGIYASGVPAVLGIPTVSGGGIASIPIVSGGSGYLSVPTITIVGDGTNATATAVITDGVLTGITITPGSGYAAAMAVLTGGAFEKYRINKQTIDEVEGAFSDIQTGPPQLIAEVPQSESLLSPDSVPNLQLLIRPIPDLPYYVTLTAYQYSPFLDGVIYYRNWLTVDHPDILLFGALIQAEMYLKNDSRILVWKEMYNEKLGDLISAESAELYSGSSRYGQGR